MRKVSWVWSLMGMVLWGLSSLASSATIVNGDFALGLTGWTTADIDGNGQSTSPSASITVLGGQAILATQGLAANITDMTLSQVTTIPTSLHFSEFVVA